MFMLGAKWLCPTWNTDKLSYASRGNFFSTCGKVSLCALNTQIVISLSEQIAGWGWNQDGSSKFKIADV